jgi:8-oxo-dGTP pyrophosphatase MutT (NUDIX family)
MPAATPTLRIGARVLLLDQNDQVLLIHARDPDQPDHHWWELPGGGAEPDETLPETARRELTEETGIVIDHLGPHLWDRETHFHYRGRQHHRRERVYLARITDTAPTLRPKHTANEKAGLIEHRWWTQTALATTHDKLLPPNLPILLTRTLNGALDQPVLLHI